MSERVYDSHHMQDYLARNPGVPGFSHRTCRVLASLRASGFTFAPCGVLGTMGSAGGDLRGHPLVTMLFHY